MREQERDRATRSRESAGLGKPSPRKVQKHREAVYLAAAAIPVCMSASDQPGCTELADRWRDAPWSALVEIESALAAGFEARGTCRGDARARAASAGQE